MLVYQYLLNIMEEHIKFENVKITQDYLPKCISCILMTYMEEQIFWIIMYHRCSILVILVFLYNFFICSSGFYPSCPDFKFTKQWSAVVAQW